MSHGGEGTLEGVEGKIPWATKMRHHSTEILGTDNLIDKDTPHLLKPVPPAVVYEIVDDNDDDPAQIEGKLASVSSVEPRSAVRVNETSVSTSQSGVADERRFGTIHMARIDEPVS